MSDSEIAVGLWRRRRWGYWLAELLPWENNDIALLARRYRNKVVTEDQRLCLDELIRIVESDLYNELYGDIRRRPMFYDSF